MQGWTLELRCPRKISKRRPDILHMLYRNFIRWNQGKFFILAGNSLLRESTFYFVNCLKSFGFSGVRRKFSRGVSFSGIWWSFVFGVRSLWRHYLMSYSCFQTNVLEKFVDIIGIFFYTHSPYFMCHRIEYKLSGPQVAISEENKLNATTQQFVTAKISGCVLKQGG